MQSLAIPITPTKEVLGDCLLTSTHLINRFPSTVLRNISPYQVLFGKTPNYTQLKPFGCLCFASTLTRNRDKLMPRALPGVFLGYPFSQKGYKVLNLQTGQVIVSRDVKFSETIFPFSHSTPMSRLFPAIFTSIQNSHIFPLQQDVLSGLETLSSDTKVHSPDSPFSNNSELPRAESSPVQSPRRSTRQHNAPSYLSDYICDAAYSVISPNPPLIPFHSYYFNALSSQSQQIVSSIYNISEPKTYQEAALHPGWQLAMDK